MARCKEKTSDKTVRIVIVPVCFEKSPKNLLIKELALRLNQITENVSLQRYEQFCYSDFIVEDSLVTELSHYCYKRWT